MATVETQILDTVVVNTRRKMLAMGGTALAALFLAGTKEANAATYSDADILNFALNLEYLEANYYYMAAFGCTIENAGSNTYAKAAGALTNLSLNGGVTVTGTGIGSAAKVPFGTTASEIAIAAYCNETAVQEGKHVQFLQTALGSSTAVAQPLINLGVGAADAWPVLAAAAKIPGAATFSPYASSTAFLYGAYVFEDVGVTAYHGAAGLLTDKGHLAAAAGILGVEAYHAGLVRTTLFNQDVTNNNNTNATVTGLISTLRANLALYATLGVANVPTSANPVTLDPNPDDFSTATFTLPTLGQITGNTTAARIVDADTTDTVNPLPLAVAFARNTTQILNIVTGGGAAASASVTVATSPAKGVFFPNGLNGLFK